MASFLTHHPQWQAVLQTPGPRAAVRGARPRLRSAWRVFALAGASLIALPGHSAIVSFETATPQSMWGTSATAILDATLFLGTEWSTPNAELGNIIGDIITTPTVPPIQITPAIPRTMITPAIPRKLLVPSKRVCIFGKCVSTPAVYSPAIPAVYSPAVPAIFSPAIPGVSIDTRTGAKIDVSTEGKVGLQQTVKADAGSVTAKVIFDATLNAPDQVAALSLFSVDAAASLLGDSAFSTNFPNLSAKTEFVIGVKADLGAQACLIGPGCVQGQTTIGFDPQSLEIISFNEDNNGRIRLLGLDALGPAAFNFGEAIAINGPTGAEVGNATLYVPNLITTGQLESGVLRSSGEADILELKADLDGIAQTAAGLPPILGAGVEIEVVNGLNLNLGYDLLDIEFGPILAVHQNFELSANMIVDFEFSDAIFVEGYDNPLSALTVPLGEIPRFALDVDQTVEVRPTYRLDAALRNTTRLGVDGEFTLDVLKASFALDALGLSFDLGSLGPLFEFSERFDIADLPPLFDQQFALQGFAPVVGEMFRLSSISTDPQTTPAVLDDAVAVLITDASVELSQQVGKPAEDEFNFSFDYLFATDIGVLQVWLGLELITQITASVVMDDFATFAAVLDADIFESADVALLRFLFDGPAGATLLLDNVMFPGILNGDFDLGSLTGRLTHWNTSSETEFGVLTVATFGTQSGVPEPRSLALLGLGMLALILMTRRRFQPQKPAAMG